MFYSKEVEKWNQKYKPVFNQIEKEVNSQARRYVERITKKRDFNATIGDLMDRFKKNNMLNMIGEEIAETVGLEGIVDENRNKSIKIRKRPPDYICCYGHYKYTINPYGAKVKRKAELFFIEVGLGLKKVRSIF